MIPEALIRARGVEKSFGEGRLRTDVLRGVSIDVWPGEICLLMGPSGSGKTTFVSIVAGLMPPSEGDVELCGQAIARASLARTTRLRRGRVGFVFQQYNLFAGLTALDNVAEPLHMTLGVPIKAAREQALLALRAVGLEERAHHKPQDLSGGEKQRVAMARAIAPAPKLIIADEPTAALDWQTSLRIMELLRAHVTRDRGALIVTHDHRLEQFADRIVAMEDGRVLSDTRLIA